jgi:hypothetical protein
VIAFLAGFIFSGMLMTPRINPGMGMLMR